MSQTKVLGLSRGIMQTLIKFIILAGVATVAPLLGHSQAITGPIVNATLFMAVLLVGSNNAILVGVIPSLIALSVGLLPAVLAPMVPFIMTANIILIVTFGLLYKKNYWLAVITASALKYLFLLSTSSIVIDLLMKKELATKVAMMMSWPQLVTALGGGVIAFVILKKFHKV